MITNIDELAKYSKNKIQIVLGNATFIASFMPVRLSLHIINISSIPRSFNSFKTPNQYFADSF